MPSAGATAAGATVVAPPPMTMEPGFPPGRNSRFSGIGTAGALTRVANVRAYPRVAELTTLEEKTRVSVKPCVCVRIGSIWINYKFVRRVFLCLMMIGDFGL